LIALRTSTVSLADKKLTSNKADNKHRIILFVKLPKICVFMSKVHKA